MSSSCSLRHHAVTLWLVVTVFLTPISHAGKPVKDPVPTSSLAADLAALVTQADTVNTQLAGISLTTDNSCIELGTVNIAVGDFLASIETIYAGLAAPISLDTESLTSLDDLSNLSTSMATSVKNLSFDLNSIDGAADLFEYEASLAAMLTLSDDIGTMAGRIGEMANRILVMADNIGIMADRILITQQLQSSNIALTQASLLTTQQNAIALSSSINTLGYNTAFAGLVNEGNSLSASMGGIGLTETNMDTELAGVETNVSLYLSGIDGLYSQITLSSTVASHFLDGDTLTMLGDLSIIHQALATSLNSYAQAIDTLAPASSVTVLTDATASMLRLTQDIGIMSDRVIEMADRIVIMADNIGIMSTRIVDTQTLQQSNSDLTQSSLLTATNTTVSVISAYGL
jgi:hypothetical protein